MRYLSVCSGIEAATQAWAPLGWDPVAFSEIEPFPCAVLKHHYSDVPNWGDMTKFKDWPDATVDVLCGGTPCQSFSVAGLRQGLADPRGNLMLTFGAIAERYGPKWIVWENVPGVLSSNGGRDFAAFLSLLGQLGYGWAYRVLDAQHVRTRRFPFAVPQRRRRVFVVGYIGDCRRAAAVLFDRESLSGHPAPRRKAGQGFTHSVAPSLTGSGRGVERAGETRGQDPVIAICADVAPTLDTAFHDKQGLDNQHINGGGAYSYVPPIVPQAISAKWAKGSSGPSGDEIANLVAQTGGVFDVAHSLRGEGFDASEDGTGRGTPLVPVAYRTAGDGAVYEEGDATAPLTTGTDSSASIVAFAQNTRDEVRLIGGDGQIVGALAAEPGMKQQAYVAMAEPFTIMERGRDGGQSLESRQDGTSNAILTPNGGRGGMGVGAIALPWAVRRLTPTECERLMGFPEIRRYGRINICLDDKSAKHANAEIRCTTGQSNALGAAESAFLQPVLNAALSFSTSHQDHDLPVALHVFIDYEREVVQLHSQGKCLWSVSIAAKPNSPPLPMPVGDFVHLIAQIMERPETKITAGRAELQKNTSHSTTLGYGNWSANVSGAEIEAHVKSAGSDTPDQAHLIMFTTLRSGRSFQTSELTLATLCCFVVNAIASFIPEQINQGNSYAVTIETVQGFTRIPYRGKPADLCPDGPRYKALGNSWAVNCASWIGERISEVDTWL